VSDAPSKHLPLPLTSAALRSAIRRISDRSRAHLELEFARVSAKALIAALSSTEIQVLALMAMGCGANDIAARLGMSPKRAGAVRRRMMAKLNVRSTAEAVRIGIYTGLDLS
jgi:DNA-binding CsgD family transcriptional regulator